METGLKVIMAGDQFGAAAGSIVALESGLSLEELEHGLDWVRWLLQSVRQRCEGICFCPSSSQVGTVHGEWRVFVRDRFEPGHGPMLRHAAGLAATSGVTALAELARTWSRQLTPREKLTSTEAGLTLLRATQGAKYQGALGRYRVLVDEGNAIADCFIIWALVGQLFQLTPINLLAEAMRLEWELGVRDLDIMPEPHGEYSIASAVTRMARGHNHEPRVLTRERRVG